MTKRTILIDLDGVLNSYNGNFDKEFIPDIKQGANEFLKNLATLYEIKIFTTRNKLQAAKWLIQNNLDIYVSDITNIKEPSYLYIDDRCICFNGNYEKTLEEIKKFQVYWK